MNSDMREKIKDEYDMTDYIVGYIENNEDILTKKLELRGCKIDDELYYYDFYLVFLLGRLHSFPLC